MCWRHSRRPSSSASSCKSDVLWSSTLRGRWPHLTAAPDSGARYVGRNVLLRNATPRNWRRGAGPTTISRCRSPTTRRCSAISPTRSSAYAGTTSTFSRRDGKFFVNTDGPDGKLADYEIKYAFGVHPLQQYLIELPGGRMQAFGIAWDSRPKAEGGQRWFHLYPGQNIKAGDLAALDRRAARTGTSRAPSAIRPTCARTSTPHADAYKTTWSELNVSLRGVPRAGLESRGLGEGARRLAGARRRRRDSRSRWTSARA